MPANKSHTPEELHALAQQEADLQSKIKEVQSFLKDGPQQHEKEQQELRQTLPAPDEIVQRRREKKFYDRLSRGELKNERRHQARNGVLFILLAIAILSISLWIYRYLYP